MTPYQKSGGFSKPSFGARPSYAPREASERFQATCASCGNACEVPFKPNGKKPIYCRDCFKTAERAAPARAGAPDLSREFELLNMKLDRLISAVEGRSRA